MQRATVIVKGYVQRVGYRDIVEKIARKLVLTGFVENLKPCDVRIVCEGEEEKIQQFLKLINVQKSPIDVSEIKADFDSPTGEFKYFEIKRGELAEEIKNEWFWQPVARVLMEIDELLADKSEEQTGK